MEMAALLPTGTRSFLHSLFRILRGSYTFPTIDYLLKRSNPQTILYGIAKDRGLFHRCGRCRSALSLVLPPEVPLLCPGALPLSQKNIFFIKSGRMLHKILLKDILYFEGEKELCPAGDPDPEAAGVSPVERYRRAVVPVLARVHIPISSISPVWTRSGITMFLSGPSRYRSARSSGKRS